MFKNFSTYHINWQVNINFKTNKKSFTLYWYNLFLIIVSDRPTVSYKLLNFHVQLLLNKIVITSYRVASFILNIFLQIVINQRNCSYAKINYVYFMHSVLIWLLTRCVWKTLDFNFFQFQWFCFYWFPLNH